jgi:hypothetical protein
MFKKFPDPLNFTIVSAKYLGLLAIIGCIFILAVLALKLLNLATENSQKLSHESVLSVVSV